MLVVNVKVEALMSNALHCIILNEIVVCASYGVGVGVSIGGCGHGFCISGVYIVI